MKSDYYSDPKAWRREPKEVKTAITSIRAVKQSPEFFLKQLMFLLSDLDRLYGYWADRQHENFMAFEQDIVNPNIS